MEPRFPKDADVEGWPRPRTAGGPGSLGGPSRPERPCPERPPGQGPPWWPGCGSHQVPRSPDPSQQPHRDAPGDGQRGKVGGGAGVGVCISPSGQPAHVHRALTLSQAVFGVGAVAAEQAGSTRPSRCPPGVGALPDGTGAPQCSRAGGGRGEGEQGSWAGGRELGVGGGRGEQPEGICTPRAALTLTLTLHSVLGGPVSGTGALLRHPGQAHLRHWRGAGDRGLQGGPACLPAGLQAALRCRRLRGSRRHPRPDCGRLAAALAHSIGPSFHTFGKKCLLCARCIQAPPPRLCSRAAESPLTDPPLPPPPAGCRLGARCVLGSWPWGPGAPRGLREPLRSKAPGVGGGQSWGVSWSCPGSGQVQRKSCRC